MAQAGPAMAGADDVSAIVGYFEVHVRRDDRWMIDCTAQRAEDALAEAAELGRRSEVQAVKVVHERYNPATDQGASRVIHDFAKPERKRGLGMARLAMARPAPPAAKPLAAVQPAPAPAEPQHHAPPPSPGRTQPRSMPPPQPVPWAAFVWATLALATAATLLFLVLAISG
jgi:hypothetical protein